MKKFLPVILFLFAFGLYAQNCTNDSIGFPPINDLGANSWRGNTGGLYPNGSNYKPAAHNLAGLNIANQIMPLDTNGNVDVTNGKVVWLSIGMSNTTQETQLFLPMANSHPQKNPKLVLIDGAQGGQDIVIISNPSANFWNVINQRLANAGLTNKQVQAVWFKEAQANPSDTAFATYPDALKLKYKTAIQVIKNKFPNTKLCYLSSRIYGGYATGTLNPEPYAYYSGWSVKRLIEDQINGDTSLTYTGSNPRVPWLAWGPYTWADGTVPRSDGLVWNCPTDFNPDGVHPSNSGRQKVAQMLLNFFTTDSTSTPWFLASSTGIKKNEPSVSMILSPNPVKNHLLITLNEALSTAEIQICNLLGEIIYSEKNIPNGPIIKQIEIDSPAGIYFITLRDKKNQYTKKFIVQ